MDLVYLHFALNVERLHLGTDLAAAPVIGEIGAYRSLQQGSHKLLKSWKTWKITKKIHAWKNHGI